MARRSSKRPHTSHEEGGEVKHAFELIHTIAYCVELLIASWGLYTVFTLGLDNSTAQASIKKLALAALSALLFLAYKWFIKKREAKRTESTEPSGGGSTSMWNLLSPHLLFYIGLGCLTFWFVRHYIKLEDWVSKEGVETQFYTLVTVIVCLLCFNVQQAYARVNSELQGRIHQRMEQALVEMYKRADLTLLLATQSFLRLMLIGIVLGVGAARVVASTAQQVSPFHSLLNDELSLNWWYVLIVYLLAGIVIYVVGNIWNAHASQKVTTSPIRGLLFVPALVDTVFITLLACGMEPLPDDYHLAYILPLTGLWVFSKRWSVYLVSAFVLMGITVTGAVHESLWIENQHLSDKWQELCAITIPRLAFWGVVLGALYSLRWLRSEETRKRKLIDAVADSLPNAVFAKDIEQRFVYMNNSLAKSLMLNVSDETKRKLGISKRRDFYGYTDFDLKLSHAAAYKITDDKAASGHASSQLEPNYDRHNTTIPFVFTNKSPYPNSPEEKVELIVGTCEEGTPHLIAQVVTAVAPYCMTLKDELNHIRWANRAFLDKDVHIPSILSNWLTKVNPPTKAANEILGLWLGDDFAAIHPSTAQKLEHLISNPGGNQEFAAPEKLAVIMAMNDSKGATDSDLYDEDHAQKFFNDDRDVIKQARIAITCKRDPVEEAVNKGWRKPEDHHFACENRVAKVLVTKIPWVRLEPGNAPRVEGVAVFYHELDS